MMILLVPQYVYYNLSTLLPLLIMKIMLCMATCNNGEYEINGECCPMCDPGKRVNRHCDEFTSTTCDSCLVMMTYTNIPNGLTKCLPCSVCDQSNGLTVKRACTLISNTVCEPLPGYYCIDLHLSCPKAMKHSTCSPGQYVNQTGTEFSDTVCNDCPVGSYSSGTLCNLHTKCESLGKITVMTGTQTSDAECSDGAPSLLIGMSVFGVCVVLFVITVVVVIIKKKNNLYSVTSPQDFNLHP